MPPDLSGFIAQAQEQYFAALEQACEAALQTGTCGVLITEHADGGATIEVTDRVPYGQIHLHRQTTP